MRALRRIRSRAIVLATRILGARSARLLRAVIRLGGIRLATSTRRLPRAIGLDVCRYAPHQLGADFGLDLRFLLGDLAQPVVFDVGANIGQSVLRFRGLLPRSVIHSFEPSPTAYEHLRENTCMIRRLATVNAAVGSADGTTVLLENDHAELSSLLPPTTAAWGQIVRSTPVAQITLDAYCATLGLDSIALLKIDTQGSELEVLRGCERLMAADHIRAVFVEVIFTDLYEGAPSFDEVYSFLVARRFRLVSFYDCQTEGRVMRWADVLFLNPRASLGNAGAGVAAATGAPASARPAG